jgi:uncharacterized membrane protein YhaH (DUF805 family)
MSIAYDARDYSHNAYSAPTAVWSQPAATTNGSGLVWLLFSFEGRATRSQYWLGSLLAVTCIGLLMILALPLVAAFESIAFDVVVLAPIVSLLVWTRFAVEFKRWHDRGKSGVWFLIGFVPYIGSIWKFIELGCLPGDNSENFYGPDPRAKTNLPTPSHEGGRRLIQPRRVSTEHLACFALSAANRPAGSSAASVAHRLM